jgi:RimJ/RimL family protein N-acetyltransferase
MKITETEVTLKNGKKIILRSPVAMDVTLVLDHLKRIFRVHYKNFNRGVDFFENLPDEKEVKHIEDVLFSPSSFMITAFDGNKIIGLLGVNANSVPFQRFNAGIGMGIETEYQNTGLGTIMMNKCFEEAKIAGLRSLQLEVRTFNKGAIALYEKSGFRRVGEMKEVAFIDGHFYDEYIYQKLLKS